MKRIEDLLNSLLSKPEDKTGLLNGLSAGSSQRTSGDQSGTFGHVLAQVTQAQNQNENQGAGISQSLQAGSGQNAPVIGGASPNGVSPVSANSFFESVSQVSITVTETLRNATPDLIRQAEQTLQNLMTGLLTLLQGLSSSNSSKPLTQDQVQALNAALGLTPGDLKSIADQLQPFVQNLPEGQNPLSLNSEQQAQLLAQVMQQMLGAQQVLFGTVPVPGNEQQGQTAAAQGIGQTSGVSGSAAILQFSFSDLRINARQDQGAQSSQVFINMETFKMSATFIQARTESQPSSIAQGLQPLNPSNVPDLTQKLQEILGGTQNPTVLSPTIQNVELMRNFKDLVRLLLQSGVTQAALTSFLSRNQANENGTSNATPMASSQVALIPPTPQPSQESLLPPVEETSKVLSTPTSVVSRNLVSQLNQISSQLTGDGAVQAQNPNGNSIPQASSGQTFSAPAGIPTTNSQAPISEPIIATTGASEKVSSGLNAVTTATTQMPGVEPVASDIEAPKVPIAREVPSGENGMVTPEPQGPPTATVTVGVPQALEPSQTPNLNLNVKTPQALQNIVISNDNASKLNAVALHATQGSLTFGDIHPLSNQVYTLDQVTGSKAATQLNSPIPAVVSGSPSVPQNTQTVPPVETMIKSHVIQSEITAALNQVQVGQTTVPAANNPSTANSVNPSKPVNGQPVEVQTTPTNVVPPLQNTTPAPSPVPSNVPAPTGNSPVAPVPVPKTDFFKGNLPNTVNGNNEANNQSRPQTLPHSVLTPVAPPATSPALPIQTAQAQGTVPPVPTASTPFVPSTVIVGEGVKAELLPVAHGILNPNQTIPPGSFQAEQTIKTQSPEGVTPLGSVIPTDVQSQIPTVTEKADPKDTASSDLAALLTTASSTVTPEDAGKFAQNIGHLSNNPRFSLDANQLFSLISTQLTVQISQARNLSRLSFQLVPESLGKVTVQMVLVDQSLSARIFVSNPEVRDAVQTHLVDLKASLSQAGLQIDQLQVQVQGGGGNLLAQYYQYQQEGSSYRGPVYEAAAGLTSPENPENSGVLSGAGSGLSLVNLLA